MPLFLLHRAMLSGLKLPSRVSEALQGISGDNVDAVVRGFEQLASATKRTEDVALNLDKLLAAGLFRGIGFSLLMNNVGHMAASLTRSTH